MLKCRFGTIFFNKHIGTYTISYSNKMSVLNIRFNNEHIGDGNISIGKNQMILRSGWPHTSSKETFGRFLYIHIANLWAGSGGGGFRSTSDD